MSTVTRVVEASPDQVWAVLSDGWTYPSWVVGASRMRAVDPTWPEAGGRLHHSVGTWPLLIDDTTEVLECDPPSHLLLRAHGWPMGSAEVDLWMTALGARTEVVMTEDVVSGPGALVPKPVRDVQIGWRNTETLRRLSFLAERRARP